MITIFFGGSACVGMAYMIRPSLFVNKENKQEKEKEPKMGIVYYDANADNEIIKATINNNYSCQLVDNDQKSKKFPCLISLIEIDKDTRIDGKTLIPSSSTKRATLLMLKKDKFFKFTVNEELYSLINFHNNQKMQVFDMETLNDQEMIEEFKLIFGTDGFNFKGNKEFEWPKSKEGRKKIKRAKAKES